jgi:hypothetical protein
VILTEFVVTIVVIVIFVFLVVITLLHHRFVVVVILLVVPIACIVIVHVPHTVAAARAAVARLLPLRLRLSSYGQVMLGLVVPW